MGNPAIHPKAAKTRTRPMRYFQKTLSIAPDVRSEGGLAPKHFDEGTQFCKVAGL